MEAMWAALRLNSAVARLFSVDIRTTLPRTWQIFLSIKGKRSAFPFH
jgi:hypothetical protein